MNQKELFSAILGSYCHRFFRHKNSDRDTETKMDEFYIVLYVDDVAVCGSRCRVERIPRMVLSLQSAAQCVSPHTAIGRLSFKNTEHWWMNSTTCQPIFTCSTKLIWHSKTVQTRKQHHTMEATCHNYAQWIWFNSQ